MILVLNCGSSSVKFALYVDAAAGGSPGGELFCLLAGEASGLPDAPRMRWHRLASGSGSGDGIDAKQGGDAGGETFDEPLVAPCPHARALESILSRVERLVRRAPEAVGHRVVHGGTRFHRPVVVDAEVLAALEVLAPLAPLHQPHNLAGIRAVAEHAPGLPQVACFDTAFHSTQPALHTTLALPLSLRERGLRRYGFHGLSYESIAGQLPELLGAAAEGRVIVAHLGNGASVCAMRERRSVRTSMSLTPLDGLVMGTRPGSIDIGVALHAMREFGMRESELSHLLYHESGLLGLSGISNDVRVLEASSDPRAGFALSMFCERAAQEIAVAAVALGGCDALVFTAGIGENSAPIRAAIVDRLAFLGARIDARANASHSARAANRGSPAGAASGAASRARALHASASSVGVWVVPTDEQEVIARHTRAVGREPGGAVAA